MEIKCPRCGSNHTVKHGFVTNCRAIKRQRMKCQQCGHTFYENVEGSK